MRVIGWWGGQSAHVVVFVIVSPGPIRSCCIFCGHAPVRLNGQPGRSVVGPGWLQLGVSNCSLVTRTAVWVHRRVVRLSLHDGAGCSGPGPTFPRFWRQRTNVWREVTIPTQRAQRLRSGAASARQSGRRRQIFGTKQQFPAPGQCDKEAEPARTAKRRHCGV
jgi:hypothetical protein